MKRVALVFSLTVLVCLLAATPSGACGIDKGPYVLNVEQTRAIIVWTTDVGADAELRWGHDANYGFRAYYDSGGILGFFSNTIHVVRIAG
jgi:hypothetical protein